MREGGFCITVTIDPASGQRIALARCRAARDALRRVCRGFTGKLTISSTWRDGLPAIVFRAAA